MGAPCSSGARSLCLFGAPQTPATTVPTAWPLLLAAAGPTGAAPHQVIAGSMMSRWGEFVGQEIQLLRTLSDYIGRLKDESRTMEAQ